MIAASFIVAVVALVVSLAFNCAQYYWRKEDRAQQERERSEIIAERMRQDAQQRKLERMPPEIYNVGGESGPIRISGSKHSASGPFRDLWALITVVNPTNAQVKVETVRLVLYEVEWEFVRVDFHLRTNTAESFEKISMMGNEKTDYELHFTFALHKVPRNSSGALWLRSSNRPDEPFAVPIYFV